MTRIMHLAFRSSDAFPASSSMSAWSSPESLHYTQWQYFPWLCGCLTWLSVSMNTTQEEPGASTALQVRNCCCLGLSGALPSLPTSHFKSCWISQRQGRKKFQSDGEVSLSLPPSSLCNPRKHLWTSKSPHSHHSALCISLWLSPQLFTFPCIAFQIFQVLFQGFLTPPWIPPTYSWWVLLARRSTNMC